MSFHLSRATVKGVEKREVEKGRRKLMMSFQRKFNTKLVSRDLVLSVNVEVVVNEEGRSCDPQNAFWHATRI